MAIAFPNSPTNGQTVTVGNLTYSWSSSENAWLLVTTVATGPTGPTGATGPIGKFVTSDTAPTSPVSGDAWFNSNRGRTYVYYNDGDSAQWVQVGSAQAGAPGVVNRNVILNSAFDIWQRGTSQTATGYGSADRFFMINSGTGTTTFSRVSVFPSAGLPFRYALKIAKVSGATSGDYFLQRIENVQNTQGQVTYSLYAYANASTTLTVYARQNFGSGGSPSGDVDTTVGTITIPSGSTLNRYSVTATLPTIAGKTIGTSTDGYVEFFVNIANSNNSETVVTGVQVEEGSVATPFQRNGANLQAELAACQRYFYSATTSDLNSGIGYAASAVYFSMKFPVEMRATPIYSGNSGSAVISDNYVANFSTGTATIQGDIQLDNRSIRFGLGGFSGLTTARMYVGLPLSMGGSWRASFSAEL